VTLIDQFAPGHERAASGAATRLIRCSSGADAAMTASAWRALGLWRELEDEVGVELFAPTGLVALATTDGAWERESERELRAQGIPVARLTPEEAAGLFPEGTDLPDCRFALHEPRAGVLFARRAIEALVADAAAHGARVVLGRGERVDGGGARGAAVRAGGEVVRADAVVWACGAWTAGLFGELVRGTTVQHDYWFFPAPAAWSGAAAGVPAWLDAGGGMSGAPDVDGRGVRLGGDLPGPELDLSDGEERVPGEPQLELVRATLRRRFPALADAPLGAVECCHSTEVEPDGFLVDAEAEIGGARIVRHPDDPATWIVGDGSGSVFKHAPSVALAVAERLDEAVGGAGA
jgi:glycine/D-amino acid oxidase-like deaminating enzyme